MAECPADDKGSLAGVTFPFRPQNIWDAVCDPVRSLGFTRNSQSVNAHRIWLRPGAGCVDDGAGQQAVLSLRVAIADDERSVGAAIIRHQIMTKPRNRGYLSAKPQAACDCRNAGERLKIFADDFCAGRQMRPRGDGHAFGGEKLARGLVDIVVPWRKYAHVPPFEHRGADTIPLLEQNGMQPPLDESRGRRKPDRSGSDDGNGMIYEKYGVHSSLLLSRQPCRLCSGLLRAGKSRPHNIRRRESRSATASRDSARGK